MWSLCCWNLQRFNRNNGITSNTTDLFDGYLCQLLVYSHSITLYRNQDSIHRYNKRFRKKSWAYCRQTWQLCQNFNADNNFNVRRIQRWYQKNVEFLEYGIFIEFVLPIAIIFLSDGSSLKLECYNSYIKANFKLNVFIKRLKL
jgi:hypothetical protein